MFARWIIREDWKDLDPDNMEFYLETALLMAQSAKMSAVGASYLDPFGYWVQKITNKDPNFVALKRGQSLMIGDIECSYHGDKGPNGARGGSRGGRATLGRGQSSSNSVPSGHGAARLGLTSSQSERRMARLGQVG